jgi:signal transduction histidine kinase/CheY-like chemotaxis protein
MRLLRTGLEHDRDIVLVRKRARRLAELLGFGRQDQTRITTALSELVRNALEYAGGGTVEFHTTEAPPYALQVVVGDKGPGIADLDGVLSGARKSARGIGVGLRGTARLMDEFTVESSPGRGTTVRVAKFFPHGAPPPCPALVARIGQALATDDLADPVDEIRRQNREMVLQLQELQEQQEVLKSLNRELHDTNRGVVALYAELDERANYLRRADELKSKFLSNMSHEFRTPLNSILALSRLLLTGTDGALTSEQEKQVEFIRKAAASLAELVDDLLDLAKVEAGKVVVTPVEFTAAALFGALRGMLRPLLVGDQVALVFDDASEVPPLHTDEAKVSQILRNFLSNAIKFTENGEVRVWAGTDSVADTVTFHVRDTGIGIAREDLGLIFEEFAQIANPMRSHIKGTGLGLPLSKKLAELLGGEIAVESAPGKGSVFSVTLPRVYRAAEGPEADPECAIEPGRIPVLVVDDDPADSFIIERRLAGSRYQPVVVRTVVGAKRVLESVQPAAVLLDIVLSGDEAWRLLLGLRQGKRTGDIPVIVVSSTGEERKAFHLGADLYLSKPIESETLFDCLDRLVGGRAATRVLVVGDDEVTRYLVRQLLPRGRYDVVEAVDGTEGLARLLSNPPDILLLDLKMPGMSGFELLDRLGREKSLDRIPAIILTSASLTAGEQERLGRAARIIAKSELTAGVLAGAIAAALEAGAMEPA